MNVLSRRTTGDRIFDIVNTVLLVFILIIVLYPLWYVIIASISDVNAVANGEVWLYPKGITWRAYERVFGNKDIMTGYKNTIMYTVVGTAVNLIMTTMGAYPLSRKDFYGRNIFTAIFTFTMFFSGGLIPTYLVIKSLGLINNFWVMVIPGAVSVWNMIIMRTYFQSTIPMELQESAMMDGCSNVRMLISIVLPLSTPIIAVMILYYGVGHWNDFFNALIYITDSGKYPLQLVLRQILVQSQLSDMMDLSSETAAEQVQAAESIKYAVIVVASAPVMCLYPFLQKYFVKGVMIGAIKG